MARPRTPENSGLPQNLICRPRKRKNRVVKYYYYTLADGKEKSLGKDKNIAILEAAKLNLDCSKNIEGKITIISVILKFEKEELPKKSSQNTIKQYKSHLKFLKIFFSDAEANFDTVEPKHIRLYLDWRKNTPSSANSEVILFKQIWNYAREYGYTKLANPVDGISKHKLKSRDIYVEDYIYFTVYELANQDMRDLLDTAYLIGQRPVDVVNINIKKQIRNGILTLVQMKTKKRMEILIQGQLKEIIDRRIMSSDTYLFLNKQGKKLTARTLWRWFDDLRKTAISHHPELEEELRNFQFRDLRAKAATDKFLKSNIEAAQNQLGHKSPVMTTRYIRKSKAVEPTK